VGPPKTPKLIPKMEVKAREPQEPTPFLPGNEYHYGTLLGGEEGDSPGKGDAGNYQSSGGGGVGGLEKEKVVEWPERLTMWTKGKMERGQKERRSASGGERPIQGKVKFLEYIASQQKTREFTKCSKYSS